MLTPCTIELLNLEPQCVSAPFTSVVGDARDLSRYADRSFDVVFAHSVIGHVGPWPDQQRMAREVRRVGILYVVQTPNHAFPIDWRTLVPGFHWLSPERQAWCFERLPVGRYRRASSPEEAWTWATRIHNLRRDQLRTLFPEGVICDERIGGFTKSFTVVGMADAISARLNQ